MSSSKNTPQKKAQQVQQPLVKQAKPKPATKPAAPAFDPFANEPKGFSLLNFKTQALIIAIIGFLFYCNSFSNESAHDDGISVIKNEYVQLGLAGIPDIMTKDAYDSYYRQMNSSNQLSGGRYRPLSFVTFAIEQQFFGARTQAELDSTKGKNVDGTISMDPKKAIHQMHIRHVISVLFFILSCVVLLYFLRYVVFPHDSFIAFLAALIFTIHPIHTEVVANVKSRDEILSLLFICLTFIQAYRYQENKKISTLAWGLVYYFLAFLSKEYAITLLALIPLSLYLFKDYDFGKSVMAALPFAAVALLYILMRHALVNTEKSENSDGEVLNNPYLFATPVEKLATEIATSLNYLKLLIFPHPLSADYSYDAIPYKDFSSIWVWLSLAVHGSLVYAFFKLIKEKSVLCFAIAFYLLHLFLVCNIFFDIGATMGERLIYHSSVGFAIALAYLLYKGYERIKPVSLARASLGVLIVLIVVLCGFKTIQRNAQWKNDITLFTADVNTVPTSVLANANAAVGLSNLADTCTVDTATRNRNLHKAIGYLDKAISIHPKFVAGHVNRGLMYFKLGDIMKAKENWDTVRIYYPTYPTLPGLYGSIANYYIQHGWSDYGKKGDYMGAIAMFQKGLQMFPDQPDLLYNVGGAYFSMKDYQDAYNAWTRCLQVAPNYAQAQQGLQSLKPLMPQPK